MACVLNSYTLWEVKLWRKYGIKNWIDLSEKISINQSAYFLDFNKKKWPDKCKKAVITLGDKFETYKYLPNKLKPKYILSSSQLIKNTENISWFKTSISNEGVIFKPRTGSSARNIYKFKYFDNRIFIKKIFDDKFLINSYSKNIPSIENLYFFWSKLTSSKEDAICIKYYKNSKSLPDFFESIVVRIITERNLLDNFIKIKWAWAELPYQNKEFVFVNLRGDSFCIDKKGELIQNTEKFKNLDKFINKINNRTPKFIENCFDLAKKLHKDFPKIDLVAWDFIPTDSGPILLEGNSHFELLLPQIINHITKNVYNWKIS